jgi:hypothetical protein
VDLFQAFAYNQEVLRSVATDKAHGSKAARARCLAALAGLAAFHDLLTGSEAHEFALQTEAKLSPQEAHYIFDCTVKKYATNGQHGQSLLQLFLADRHLCGLRDSFLRAAERREAAEATNTSRNSNSGRSGGKH